MDELAWIDLESRGEADDLAERGVTYATFDAAEVGPVHVGMFGELFLAVTEFVATLTDPFTELDLGAASPGSGHSAQ